MKALRLLPRVICMVYPGCSIGIMIEAVMLFQSSAWSNTRGDVPWDPGLFTGYCSLCLLYQDWV